MNILTIGNFGHGWDGSICDEEHIAKELEMYGHQVKRLQREDARILNMSENYDFVLIAQWEGYDEALVEALKDAYGCLIVYWAFDYQFDGQAWHERLVDKCDLYLSKRLADAKYPNWQWLTQDFAPMLLDKAEEVEKDIDILFTGSYVPHAGDRIETLKAIDEKYNLVVHSITADQWKAIGLKNVNGPVMDAALPGLIARAKINISVDIHLENGYWSDRNSQIMACGGFVLSRYQKMAEATFRDKVVYFYSVQDCLDKIELYLNTPGGATMRDMIAEDGYLYAKQNLMVRNRVKDLLTIIEAYL